MSLQRRTLRIVRDVIGIVLDWNDRHLSDKEAMKEITRSLLIHKDNNEKKIEKKEENDKTENEVFELEDKEEEIEAEKNDEVKNKEEEKKETVQVKERKKILQNVKFGKKLVLPLIISSFSILIVVGIVNPYDVASNFEVGSSTEDKSIQLREIPPEDSIIRSEQFLKIPSENIERIQNGSEVMLEP